MTAGTATVTPVSFFKEIETEAKTAIVNIWSKDIEPFLKSEAAAFKPLIQATAVEVVQYGLPIVLSFFGTAGAALSGTAKMSAAIPQLISALGSAGKSIAVQDAQAGLQLIVKQIKDEANALVPGTAS